MKRNVSENRNIKTEKMLTVKKDYVSYAQERMS